MKISLRKANFSDIGFLWYLRNQPDVYKYFRTNRAVNWKEHVNWVIPIILGKTLKNLFIIRKNQTPIGQIRFDYKNLSRSARQNLDSTGINDKKEAEISASIPREFRGKGFAARALNLAIKRMKKQQKIQRLVATIHKKNLISIKLFEKLNFSFKKKRGNWLKYSLDL